MHAHKRYNFSAVFLSVNENLSLCWILSHEPTPCMAWHSLFIRGTHPSLCCHCKSRPTFFAHNACVHCADSMICERYYVVCVATAVYDFAAPHRFATTAVPSRRCTRVWPPDSKVLQVPPAKVTVGVSWISKSSLVRAHFRHTRNTS